MEQDLNGKVKVVKNDLQDKITKLKAEIFDIITQEGTLANMKASRVNELNALINEINKKE